MIAYLGPAGSRPWDEHIDPPAEAGDHYADLVEQLFREFEDSLSLCRIVSVLQQCRHELSGGPELATPELLERLARHRLAAAADTPGHPTVGPDARRPLPVA